MKSQTKNLFILFLISSSMFLIFYTYIQNKRIENSRIVEIKICPKEECVFYIYQQEYCCKNQNFLWGKITYKDEEIPFSLEASKWRINHFEKIEKYIENNYSFKEKSQTKELKLENENIFYKKNEKVNFFKYKNQDIVISNNNGITKNILTKMANMYLIDIIIPINLVGNEREIIGLALSKIDRNKSLKKMFLKQN